MRRVTACLHTFIPVRTDYAAVGMVIYMAEHGENWDDIDLSPFLRTNCISKSNDELSDIAGSDKFAAYELGRRYKRSHDTQQAIKYFSLSANLGDVDAPLEVALLLDTQKRYKEAVPYLEMSIERKNDPRSHTIIGRYYASGYIGGIFKRDKLSFQHFMAAAEQGYPEAQFLLALNYYQGKGVKTSFDDFAFWMRCAMLNDHKPAIQFMNKFFLDSGDELSTVWRRKLLEADSQISLHPEYIQEYLRRKNQRRE